MRTLIAERLRSRHGHFADEQILASQLADLEEPEEAVTVDIGGTPQEIVAEDSAEARLGVESSHQHLSSRTIWNHTLETAPDRLESAVVSRLMWRLMPFLFLLYIVAYLDRINVSFAVLQMRGQLGLSDRVYGRAAGMFFAGYFFFQLPSNLVLEKFGVRRWISGLMITWGVISCLMIFIRGPVSFYGMRFLLGAAEAGFFPGMILYMKRWFPANARARAVAWFMTANPHRRHCRQPSLRSIAWAQRQGTLGLAMDVSHGGDSSDSSWRYRVLGFVG